MSRFYSFGVRGAGLADTQTYRVISDLHTELWPENFYRATKTVDRLLPPMEDDKTTILLLAGDIGSHRRRNVYKAVVDHLCDRFNAVADIPGNHFWFGGADWEACAPPTTRANYAFGHTVSDFDIVGATLWTDFRRGNPDIERRCVSVMNDFEQVSGLTPELVKARHAEQFRFLMDEVWPGSVVMTHFAPSIRSIPEAERDDDAAGYYATDLEDFIRERQPALWVHGHIHDQSDYEIGETRIVCNPAGYDGRGHKPTLKIKL